MTYKKGDKVKALKSFANIVEGDIYTIKGDSWYLDWFVVEECKDGNILNPANFELVANTFKKGDSVICLNNEDSALLSVNETYEVENVNLGMSKDYITLKDIADGCVAFHKDRFIKAPNKSLNAGDLAMQQICEQVTQPVQFFDNSVLHQAYTTFTHDDGFGVTTQVSIDGSQTWVKLLQEYVNFLRGIGYRINNDTIKISYDMESKDWHGEYHYED